MRFGIAERYNGMRRAHICKQLIVHAEGMRSKEKFWRSEQPGMALRAKTGAFEGLCCPVSPP